MRAVTAAAQNGSAPASKALPSRWRRRPWTTDSILSASAVAILVQTTNGSHNSCACSAQRGERATRGLPWSGPRKARALAGSTSATRGAGRRARRRQIHRGRMQNLAAARAEASKRNKDGHGARRQRRRQRAMPPKPVEMAQYCRDRRERLKDDGRAISSATCARSRSGNAAVAGRLGYLVSSTFKSAERLEAQRWRRWCWKCGWCWSIAAADPGGRQGASSLWQRSRTCRARCWRRG